MNVRITEIFHTGCGGRNNYDHHGGGGYGGGWGSYGSRSRYSSCGGYGGGYGGGWGSYGHRSGYRHKNRDHGGCDY
jgi:hypothetical protein